MIWTSFACVPRKQRSPLRHMMEFLDGAIECPAVVVDMTDCFGRLCRRRSCRNYPRCFTWIESFWYQNCFPFLPQQDSSVVLSSAMLALLPDCGFRSGLFGACPYVSGLFATAWSSSCQKASSSSNGQKHLHLPPRILLLLRTLKQTEGLDLLPPPGRILGP